MKCICLLIIVCMLFGSQSCSRKSATIGDLSVIDLSKSYPKKEVHLQGIADIEYVPLETSNTVLLGTGCRLSYVSDKYIVVSQQRFGDVFVFERSGKIVTHLNQRGPGDKEYSLMAGVVFDEKNEEIFVFDSFQTSRILVYSLTGEYKRTAKYDENLRTMSIYNFDDETILVYDTSHTSQIMGTESQRRYNEKPYLFLSKEDGSTVDTLNIFLPERYSNRIMYQWIENGRQMGQPLTIWIPNNRHFGQDFIIADISSDTIYRLTRNKECIPILVRTPSVHSSEPRKVLSYMMATDNFLHLYSVNLDFEAAQRGGNIHAAYFLYEFESGQISVPTFINDDFPSQTEIYSDDVDFPRKNMLACMIDITFLKDAHEENKLKGKLEQLVPTLGEEDNPVIMIVNFK